MLGCMIVDHFRPNFASTEGNIVITAITDVLLTKLMFAEDRFGEGSDALYKERFKSYAHEYHLPFSKLDLTAYYQAAMVPIGLRYGSSDDECDWEHEMELVKSEARLCLQSMGIIKDRIEEGEMLASLVFLGKGGTPSSFIPYFVVNEYGKTIDNWSRELSHILQSLVTAQDFVDFLDKACIFNDPSLQMLCGGLGQVFFNRLPAKWVDATLDEMDYDQKTMVLSFLKRFECLPSW